MPLDSLDRIGPSHVGPTISAGVGGMRGTGRAMVVGVGITTVVAVGTVGGGTEVTTGLGVAVAVGGTAVAVGGTAVAVGGTGVLVRPP